MRAELEPAIEQVSLLPSARLTKSPISIQHFARHRGEILCEDTFGFP
jgi:hypothetical protein